MNRPIVFAVIAAAATSLALLLLPALVAQLLVGAELTGIVVIMARQAGIAMVALAIVCWSGTRLLGMLGYTAASALCLAPRLYRRRERRAAVAGSGAALRETLIYL